MFVITLQIKQFLGEIGLKNDDYLYNKHTRALTMIKGIFNRYFRNLLTFLFPLVFLGLDVKVSV